MFSPVCKPADESVPNVCKQPSQSCVPRLRHVGRRREQVHVHFQPNATARTVSWTQFVTPEHFDYVKPHPLKSDRFMGLDVEKNGKTYTVYVCDNVFGAGSKCTKGASQIKDAQWIQANSDTNWGMTNFGVYYTKYRAGDTDGKGKLDLFEWAGDTTNQLNKINGEIVPIGNMLQMNAFLYVTDAPVPVSGQTGQTIEHGLYVRYKDKGRSQRTTSLHKVRFPFVRQIIGKSFYNR